MQRLGAILFTILAVVLLAGTVAFNVANGDVTVFSVIPAGLALLAAAWAAELWDA